VVRARRSTSRGWALDASDLSDAHERKDDGGLLGQKRQPEEPHMGDPVAPRRGGAFAGEEEPGSEREDREEQVVSSWDPGNRGRKGGVDGEDEPGRGGEPCAEPEAPEDRDHQQARQHMQGHVGAVVPDRARPTRARVDGVRQRHEGAVVGVVRVHRLQVSPPEGRPDQARPQEEGLVIHDEIDVVEVDEPEPERPRVHREGDRHDGEGRGPRARGARDPVRAPPA
jgi:hypothetical protein